VRRAALAALGIIIFAAGCGGGGTRLTAAEFSAKAQAICAGYSKRAQKEIARLDIDPASPAATSLDWARFHRQLEQVSRLFRAQLADLRALRPPAAGAAHYAEVLRLYQDASTGLEQAARAARKGDRRAVLEILTVVGQMVQRTQNELGFRCE
jgi:hypothetical protein